MARVALFGASGHLGQAVLRRLRLTDAHEVQPIAHSSGNAWGLAREGTQFLMADMASKEQIHDAIAGCDVVVNCALPPGQMMIPCQKNLLKVCLANKIKRFVHISSVAVYGEPPTPESVHEHAKARPAKRTYGWYKLQQDILVSKASRAGLSSVVLCPPNITGSNSPFILKVLSALREGRLALVDGGGLPCNLVDADNLAAAACLAIGCDQADGKRIFITDGGECTWQDVVDGLMPVLDGAALPPSIDIADALAIVGAAGKKPSLMKAMKRIFGVPAVRDILKDTPAAQGIHDSIKGFSKILPKRMRRRLESGLRGQGKIQKIVSRPSYDIRMLTTQVRRVRHSTDRAHEVLGYKPVLSTAESLSQFCTWCREFHGYGGEYWPLLRELYPRVASGQ
jgi:nucleoside-diphosphate-sugar epimerase